MLKRVLIFILAAYACVACQHHVITESSGFSDKGEVYASIELLDPTRTGVGSNNDVLWSAGDRISVFDFTSFNDEYVLMEGYEGMESGTFQLVPSLSDDMQHIVSISHRVSFYPYQALLDCFETQDGYLLRGFEIPSSQNWTSLSFESGIFPMVAVSSSSESISFRNICGILKLLLKGTKSVKRIILEGHRNEVLSGKMLVLSYPDERDPVISELNDGHQIVTLDCAEGVNLNPLSPTEFMFVLPPVDFTDGFTVHIEYVGGEMIELSTDKKNPVQRSKILRMPEVDLDALEDEKNNEIVAFTDHIVEEAFVRLYDADGDQLLSVAEAGRVTSIESYFFGDDSDEVISLDDLVNFTSLSTISDDAFSGCALLESVTLPKSLKIIGRRAFADCLSLSDVRFNEGLESVGAEAFRSCYNLFQMYFPSSVTTIEEGAFKDCINMEGFSGEIVCTDGRTLICDDVLVAYASSGQAKFSYQVPSGVSRIGAGAFYNSRNIISVSLGSEVESIGDEAFYGCGLLEYVEMCAGLERIGERAFARCLALSELSLPETVNSLAYMAFADRTDLDVLYVNAITPPKIDRTIFDKIPQGLEIYVPEQSLEKYYTADGWNLMRDYIYAFGGGDDGDGDDDDDDDGVVTTLQKASKGNGINIILMGDAFSETEIKDGTYDEYMEDAMEALFSAEPYTTYRSFFNVYSINVISDRSGYSRGTGKLETFFGEGTHVGGNDETVMEYAMEVLDDDEMHDALILVLMNREYYAGTCYMYYPSDGDYGRGLSIAYFPLGTDEEMFSQLLLHEAAGHGFAKLDDEYSYDGRMPASEMTEHRRLAKYGWHRNVDLTSDWDEVKWSRFLYDERYVYEGLGVYEGASTYRYGAYRPTYDSIMNNNQGGFNAPSREAIWYRMHKLAYGESWRYDYEDFVEYDMVNLRQKSYEVKSPSVSYPPLAPPVVRQCTWREFMDKSQTNL